MAADLGPPRDALPVDFLFDITANLDPAYEVGQTARGIRNIVPVSGGAFTGPRLTGEVMPSTGGDWFLAREDGGELDVRLVLRTEDGALIYMTYWGVLQADAALMARLMGGEDVDPSTYYFRTTPRFETGDERYAWLNQTVGVALGQVLGGAVRYQVYRLQ